MKNLRLLYISACVILTGSCGQRQNSETAENYSTIKSTVTPGDKELEDGSIPIFYNMYLSVEMTSLFESIGASFEPFLLNPLTNEGDYLMSTKKAMNLGVFAVDLSYAKVFQEYDIAGKYLSAMHKLSEELGIPGEHFITTAKRIEDNISDKDSLYKIANEIYVTTDTYLKENDREGAAALIVMGGWMEAMYIASGLFESGVREPVFLSRIADQKYSLDDLIDLLDDYADDEIIGKYLSLLKELRLSFNDFTVDFDNTQPAIDKMKRMVPQINNIRKQIID